MFLASAHQLENSSPFPWAAGVDWAEWVRMYQLLYFVPHTYRVGLELRLGKHIEVEGWDSARITKMQHKAISALTALAEYDLSAFCNPRDEEESVQNYRDYLNAIYPDHVKWIETRLNYGSDRQMREILDMPYRDFVAIRERFRRESRLDQHTDVLKHALSAFVSSRPSGKWAVATLTTGLAVQWI